MYMCMYIIYIYYSLAMHMPEELLAACAEAAVAACEELDSATHTY